MTTTFVLPQVATVVIEDFLGRQSTGQIVLHVKDGRIMQVEANAITKIRDVDKPA